MTNDHTTVTVCGSPWDHVHYAKPGRAPGSWVLRCSGRTVRFAMPGNGPREGYSVWCARCVKRFGLPGQVPEWAIEQGRDNARKANELAEQRERRIADKAAGVRPISSHTRSLWSTSPEGRLAERERRLARRVQDLGGPHDERTPEA
jgi:hypothetical protein